MSRDAAVLEALPLAAAVLLQRRKPGLLRVWNPRAAQIPPDWDWFVWLILAGRGYGKTRTGAEWVRAEVEAGRRKRLALIAPTAADARDIMVEGESGLLAISSPAMRPHYEPSKRRLTWPNGALATLYSAEEPERLRGPQHDGFWGDELAIWKHLDETWSNLQFGLRLGTRPRGVVTTTPKPRKLIRDLVAEGGKSVAVVRGSTFENAENLAPSFLEEVTRRYEGTRLGRQELHAELLEDVPGALWTRAQIDALRVATAPALKRVVVAVDPAATSSDESDETGIGVAGLGEDGHGYVLADLSCRKHPAGWGRDVVKAFADWDADRIVAESNNGGEMVEHVIRTVDRTAPVTLVHASRGKYIRAEPVAALYEQGRAHHVGSFPELEDQMCTWLPDTYDGSPDRMDWLVWAMTELLPLGRPVRSFRPL